jgi:hypothetical protein
MMNLRMAFAVLALALAGCDQQIASQQSAPGEAPQLDSPAPESQPSALFIPNNDAARGATGQLTMSVTLRLPDAGSSNTDQQEVLMLRGASGLVVEAVVTGAVSPATQVQGQTLRGLLAIPVEEPQVLVYRVTDVTKPEGVEGLCGDAETAFVVLWEPSAPGAAAMKLMGTTGGAPGAASARACPMLDYRRG